MTHIVVTSGETGKRVFIPVSRIIGIEERYNGGTDIALEEGFSVTTKESFAAVVSSYWGSHAAERITECDPENALK